MAQITNARAIRDVELILFSTSPHYEARRWAAAGVECRRDRHRYTGQGYAFSVEILQFAFSGRGCSAWEAMIVTERWFGRSPENVVRGQKWMKLVSGKAADLKAWARCHRPAGAPYFEAEAMEELDGASLDI